MTGGRQDKVGYPGSPGHEKIDCYNQLQGRKEFLPLLKVLVLGQRVSPGNPKKADRRVIQGEKFFGKMIDIGFPVRFSASGRAGMIQEMQRK
jgi:hypothetical protein